MKVPQIILFFKIHKTESQHVSKFQNSPSSGPRNKTMKNDVRLLLFFVVLFFNPNEEECETLKYAGFLFFVP